MANDFWSDLPQSTSSDFWADLDKQQAKQAPQRDEQELARLKAVREGRAKPTYTTPGQELQRSNRPLTKAREAFTQSMSEPTIGGVSAYWNPLRLLQAGAESAGEAVGTTAHNIASNIPGLGGPAGVVPAAIGALANTETQTLGLGTPKNILGAAKGIDKTLRSTGSLIKRALRTPIRESTIARVPESIAKLPPANYEALEKQLASTPDVADIFDRAAEVAENGPPGIRPSTKNLLKYYRANFRARMSWEGPDLMGKDLMESEQRLQREIERYANQGTAGYDPQTAHFLRNVRSQVIDQLDGLGGANQAYARQKTMEELMSMARKSANPGVEIRDRLATDPHLGKLFTPEQQKDLVDWMDKAGRVPAGRTRGKQIATLAKTLGSILAFGYGARETGRFLARQP